MNNDGFIVPVIQQVEKLTKLYIPYQAHHMAGSNHKATNKGQHDSLVFGKKPLDSHYCQNNLKIKKQTNWWVIIYTK